MSRRPNDDPGPAGGMTNGQRLCHWPEVIRAPAHVRESGHATAIRSTAPSQASGRDQAAKRWPITANRGYGWFRK